MKGGIIGVDFLRPDLGPSLALDDLLPPLLLVVPFERPFPFNSVRLRKPFVRLVISEDELSGVLGMRVMSCGRDAPGVGAYPR